MHHSSQRGTPAGCGAVSTGRGALNPFLFYFLFILIGIPASFLCETLDKGRSRNMGYWVESSNRVYVPHGALKSVRHRSVDSESRDVVDGRSAGAALRKAVP